MKKNDLRELQNFDFFQKVGILCILLLIVSCVAYPRATTVATASFTPSVIPGTPSSTSSTKNIGLRYVLDRSDVPLLTYNAITLKIFVGMANSVRAFAAGIEIPVVYDSLSGFATVTTNANVLDLTITGGVRTAKSGTFSITPLKEDRQWAWSHSFDDNVNFKQKGIPAFDQYGWRASVYLIGWEIEPTRNEGWIIDQPDIETLLKKGWGIGNHSWSHSNVADFGGANLAKQDIKKLAAYLRQVADASGHPNYRLMSFAAPNFDDSYQPIILDLRNSSTTDLLYNESGSSGILRIDSGVTDNTYGTFNSDSPVGRDWRIDQFGTNSDEDQAFRSDLDKMVSSMDSTHHYWLNTFTHDVDSKSPNTSIFAFLPWVYNTYGPKGNNAVWVAPSEEIYSYLLVRNQIKISFSFVDSGIPPTETPSTSIPPSVDHRLYFLPVVEFWTRGL